MNMSKFGGKMSIFNIVLRGTIRSFVKKTWISMFLGTVFMLIFIAAGFPLEVSFLVGKVKVTREGKKIKANMGTKMKTGEFKICPK